MQNNFLEELASRIDNVTESAGKEFGALTASQLNWKPSENKWSIAQCLDHIIVSNETYFPQLETIISGRWRNSFWQNMPIIPKMWGKMLIKSVSPEIVRKTKTSKVFYPVSSGIPLSIIKEFTSHNHTLKEFIEKSHNANLDKIVITSPVSGFITYSLHDAFIILVSHEERHFLQAKRVKESTGFPS